MDAIDVQAVLDAYAMGIFPMADARDHEDFYWVEPKMRGIIPLDSFNIPRSLKKFMADCPYSVTINRTFPDVIAACAETPRGDGKGTWINHMIEHIFLEMHRAGHAHSVEVWDGDRLVGGLYGLSQGGCFNGESMFSCAENASKIALVYLVERMKEHGLTLLDTQFINPHLEQFGCIEIPQAEYLQKLDEALKLRCSFG